MTLTQLPLFPEDLVNRIKEINMPATATRPNPRAAAAAKKTTARRTPTTPKTTTKEATVPATKTSTAKKTTTTGRAKRTTKAKATPQQPESPALTQATVQFAINTDEGGAVKLPKGKGGVRFNAPTQDAALSTVYLSQNAWNSLGQPSEIEVTVTAK